MNKEEIIDKILEKYHNGDILNEYDIYLDLNLSHLEAIADKTIKITSQEIFREMDILFLKYVRKGVVTFEDQSKYKQLKRRLK